MSEEDQNQPYLYWISKLHKSPYQHRFIAGSSKCTTKDLSCLLTKVLSTTKDRLAQVHSLDQSTIRVIQDPIRCFRNRDPQADGKNGTCTIRTVRFSSPLILLRSYCSKMNSSGLFEVKSKPIRWRSNSHSTFLSALCQGDKQTMAYSLFTCTASKMDSKLYQSGQNFCES